MDGGEEAAAGEGDHLCQIIQIVGIVSAALISVGAIIGFVVHHFLHPQAPRCYLQQLYVPTLDLSAANSNSTTINPFLFFALTLETQFYYQDIHLTFYYGRKAVADYVIPAFHNGGSDLTIRRRDVVETHGLPWEDALHTVSTGSTAAFRLELATQVRVKVTFWYTDWKMVAIAADVPVTASGLKATQPDIRVSAAPPQPRIGVFLLFLTLLLF